MSVLHAAAWLPWLLLGLPAGVWVDRLPRRRLMLACDAVPVLALASVPVAAWCGVLSVPQLLVVALVAGASAVFFGLLLAVIGLGGVAGARPASPPGT